jgi:hypothetical protein
MKSCRIIGGKRSNISFTSMTIKLFYQLDRMGMTSYTKSDRLLKRYVKDYYWYPKKMNK